MVKKKWRGGNEENIKYTFNYICCNNVLYM